MKDPSSNIGRKLFGDWRVAVAVIWFFVNGLLAFMAINYALSAVFDRAKNAMTTLQEDTLMAHMYLNAFMMSIVAMIVVGMLCELYEARKRMLAKRDKATVIAGRLHLSPSQTAQLQRELTRSLLS